MLDSVFVYYGYGIVRKVINSYKAMSSDVLQVETKILRRNVSIQCTRRCTFLNIGFLDEFP